jgi:hypothetical protein
MLHALLPVGPQLLMLGMERQLGAHLFKSPYDMERRDRDDDDSSERDEPPPALPARWCLAAVATGGGAEPTTAVAAPGAPLLPTGLPFDCDCDGATSTVISCVSAYPRGCGSHGIRWQGRLEWRNELQDLMIG